MNWRHVQLIFQREMLDQLRDRRTLFTIAVLPLLLYPLMGMLMMQMAQFKRDYPVRVEIIGIDNWPSDVPLVDADGKLVPELERDELRGGIEFTVRSWPAEAADVSNLMETTRQAIAADRFDAALLVFPDFEQQLRSRLAAGGPMSLSAQEPGQEGDGRRPTHAKDEEASASTAGSPSLQLIANLARDRSQTARRRLEQVLDRWRSRWVARQLDRAGLSPQLVEPLPIQATDLAPPKVRKAMLWSKVLPFVMLVWALTGAFYPAIDLCAGEKERGTLETLLSSPARRQEIVWGKLATICVFSIATAVLNLLSMHVTAGIVLKQMVAHGAPGAAELLGPMPVHAFGWLILLLLPLSAFFSALALAVAALARSTKEGQYYLMPLLLVTLPLVALPMMPSLELSVSTSLVPVSGAVFLVRSLIEGRYAEAAMHLPVVLAVTVGCCWLAIRWAIRQFESEAVMFRESERWNLRLWVHHLWRDRREVATPTEALLCGVIILVAMFFAQMLAGASINSWPSIVTSTVVVQIGIVLAPAVLMATLLTNSLRESLRLRIPQWSHLAAAILLGIGFHPWYRLLASRVAVLFPIGEETAAALQYFERIVMAQPWWVCVGLLALLPAVCEELTFRGFIFSGLERHGRRLGAILVSAIFFGWTHNLLPQSIAATLMGVLLGVVAWRTGSVWCTMIMHGMNNAMSLLMAWHGHHGTPIPDRLTWMLRSSAGTWEYTTGWTVVGLACSVIALVILFRRPATPPPLPCTAATTP
ncbi:MAG: sodium extrusion protein NatB [Pirellulaceae bacterium]|nr:MAG: sodium extrusion protein NatB [Pirellulaceae bacterium]